MHVEKEVDNIGIEAAIQYTDSYTESVYSFANTINTIDGGTHLTGLRSSLTRVVNDYARKNGLLKDADPNFSGDDTREGLTAIGRAQENDIVITDALVSRHHAQITLDGGTCQITDLGSGNGTFLNGERINGSKCLRPGDVVRIADSEEFRLLEI